ncbi:MAG: (2Fe-2S)-binding protein [Thiotrichales bacterium]|nr:(2Fe-2S)-binding protein [Thiotrichales bacterium]
MNLALCQKNYVQMLIAENPIICTCHHRYFNEILESLPHHTEKASVEWVQKLTGASTGCGSCLAKVEGIVECYRLKPQVFTKDP